MYEKLKLDETLAKIKEREEEEQNSYKTSFLFKFLTSAENSISQLKEERGDNSLVTKPIQGLRKRDGYQPESPKKPQR